MSDRRAEPALSSEGLAEKCRRIVAAWPPLTDKEIDAVVAIIRGGVQ